MNSNDLEKLNAAVEVLVTRKTFLETIDHLSEDIKHARDSFVWSVIDLTAVESELPDCIRSCWIFVLKKDVSSGCHYHPNSIQHMVTLKGRGMSKIAGEYKRMTRFGSPNASPGDTWLVIEKSVPHEFFPEKEDMVVVSFHTCEAHELEEVSCETGESRLYEEERGAAG
jgi:hypothetical protein